MAPFSWRYHPYPVDLYRFTPEGLNQLFNHSAQYDVLEKGFDISLRRKDGRGGNLPNNADTPPVDSLVLSCEPLPTDDSQKEESFLSC